jgi:hypothetical protein
MLRQSLPILLLNLCAWTLIARGQELPLTVPVDGEPFRAAFAGATDDSGLRFTVDGQERTLPAADLVFWGRFVDPSRGLQVVLAGGGLIVSETARLDGENVTGESVSFGKWQLPVDLVAGIILRPPLDPAAADKLLARVSTAMGRDDRLLLDNGDEVSGTLTGFDEKQATIRRQGGPLEIKADALAAIVFDPSLTNRPRASGLRIVTGFQDGSRLPALEMTSSGSNTNLKLSGGAQLSSATTWIVALQVLGGGVEYLSDLKPISYRHIPYLELAWPYRDDRSVAGIQLRAGRQFYLKGLGMHSPARITYELADDYRRFAAEVAIDDEARERGSVLFRVFVDDGSGEWQEKATSPILRGGEPPQSLSADLTGAKRISLLVDFADRGDELDHADWLNARLVK